MSIKAMIARRVARKIALGLDDAVISGEGYEALVTRNGIVVGRVYIGSIENVENPSRPGLGPSTETQGEASINESGGVDV